MMKEDWVFRANPVVVAEEHDHGTLGSSDQRTPACHLRPLTLPLHGLITSIIPMLSLSDRLCPGLAEV